MRLSVLAANGSLTCLNLDALAVWRLHTVLAGQDLAVAVGYPGPAGLQNVVLGGIPFPQGTEELVKQIAKMALSGRTLDEDLKVTVEGIRGLVNYQGVRPGQVEEIMAMAGELLGFAHKIREALLKRQPQLFKYRTYEVDITS